MKTFFFILVLFLTFSCSKDEGDPSLKYFQCLRIKKINGFNKETVFTYNEKGLLTKIDNSLPESYEIIYNASNLPVKIVSYSNGYLNDYYYLITWGQNQFTCTMMPEENHASVTCYTLNENKIARRITKTRAEDGKELVCDEKCTWFGNDSLYVETTDIYNRRSIDKYKFCFRSMFKNINLAVLTMTSTTLFFPVYQNQWLESQWVGEGDNEIRMNYGPLYDYGPGAASMVRYGTYYSFDLEYERY